MLQIPEITKSDISTIRQEIDATDEEIVALLNRRMQLALSAGAAKLIERRQVTDLTRESEVIDHVCKANDGPMTDDQLIELYIKLMQQSRDLQVLARDHAASQTEATAGSV